MWQITGKPVDAGIFRPFEPEEILYEFDGPRTFTHRDRDGQLFLAHWCDEASDFIRFIVVPVSVNLVQKLKSGEITLREALDQPRSWILDWEHSGEVRQVSSIKLSDLPDDVLPKAGTMLWPSLEPARGPNSRLAGSDSGQSPTPKPPYTPTPHPQTAAKAPPTASHRGNE